MKISAIGFLALLACFLAVTLIYLPFRLISPDRTPITRTPAAVALQFEEVVFKPNDEQLDIRGWWMKAPKAKAALIFVHGGNSNKQAEFFRALDFYAAMVNSGVSVLAIDLRNHGASDGASHGIQFGHKEKEDVKAASAWLRANADGTHPVYLMGISMGGATSINAVADGLYVDGLILVDPLLDTQSALENAMSVGADMPRPMGKMIAWSATSFFSVPSGKQAALVRARDVSVPILLIQDPQDPVTEARYAKILAEEGNVHLWLAPQVNLDDPRLARKEKWGTHVAAFDLFPDETLEQIGTFMHLSMRANAE